MIARALLKEFPEDAGLFAIGALQLGSRSSATTTACSAAIPAPTG